MDRRRCSKGSARGAHTLAAVAVVAVLVAGAPGASRAAEGPASGVRGVDHVGLTVTDLPATEGFFVSVLGFEVVRRDEAYPASFLSNGHTLITLWRATDPETAVAFDRKRNVGLHHLAFAVESFAELEALHERLVATEGVRIEFAPEPLSGGPARHMMIREPSGNRLEFIHRPALASQ